MQFRSINFIYIIQKFKGQEFMSRLHEFITRIRNCKTMAQERAEYQKEMAVIRESFNKNEETLRPRNVTKLLFINMSGQETNFGQMECLKLITGSTLIEKRIGYLGLTQLFNEKSELLMMATNRIRVDLTHNNNHLVGLALCVLSEICTPQLAGQLHKEVLKCTSSSSRYVKKKAILTGIKLIKKAPEYLNEFLQKVIEALDDKNHGVLLAVFAFLENALAIDESIAPRLAEFANKYSTIYKYVTTQYNSQYEIGGVQDPFLQVTILRYLRALRRSIDDNNYLRVFGQILVSCHDAISSKIGSSTKNAPNAVLFECFQCMMTIPPNRSLSHYTESVLTKFISVKDPNSKYLSLFNLGLMAKHDIEVARTYKGTIIECLQQNDILIQIMALDLIYLIADENNSNTIVKQLLNVLLQANDDEFISELALKICLVVEKHSESKRWHFDTILKVLVLADRAVKEDSTKSLVYLIIGTPQLQQYCLSKLFFSACENPQNNVLCQVTMYLLGQFGQSLVNVGKLRITRGHIINLIQKIMYKATATDETLEYGLTALFKLFDKFRDESERIGKIIRTFESHANLEVQKRACEYTKLLESAWNGDREREICIPIPTLRASAEKFSEIPTGETSVDLDPNSVQLPEKLQINYEEHFSKSKFVENKEVKISHGHSHPRDIIPTQNTVVNNIVEPTPPPEQVSFKKKKIASLLDDDDDQAIPPPPPQEQLQQQNSVQVSQNSDPFDILGLDIGGSSNPNPNPNPIGTGNNINFAGNSGNQVPSGNMGGDLLGGFSLDNVSNPPPQSSNFGGDLLGGGISQPPFNSNPNPISTSGGFDLLGGGNQNNSSYPTQPQNTFQPPQTQPQIEQHQPQFQPQTHKFKAFETQHIELWMEARKQSQQNTKIIASFMNKTPNYIDGITIQPAVLKYLKITCQPLNNNAMPANSKAAVKQTMAVVNSTAGQKPIVMKIKLSYTMIGQKFNYEAKIDGFPLGF